MYMYVYYNTVCVYYNSDRETETDFEYSAVWRRKGA